MPGIYTYQGKINDTPGARLTINGEKISGEAFTNVLTGTPAQVREASKSAIAWRNMVRNLEGGSDGDIDIPIKISFNSLPHKIDLDVTIGNLVRKASYDNKTGMITTQPGKEFEVSIYSWLFFHAAYQRLCDAAEVMAKTPFKEADDSGKKPVGRVVRRTPIKSAHKMSRKVRDDEEE